VREVDGADLVGSLMVVAVQAEARDSVSDVDLVTRARQGDSAAFGELVDRHRSAVYRASLNYSKRAVQKTRPRSRRSMALSKWAAPSVASVA